MQRFLDQSRAYLMGEYLPKVRVVVAPLSEADIWWRPAEGSNSIGNLLLHIEGNARQWIVGGVGVRQNSRDRDGEFAARETLTKQQLVDRLAASFSEIDDVLSLVTPAQLGERRNIQGADVTVFEAIYHVVEHVSMHVGQVIQLAKWRAPGVIRLYDASSTSFTPLWSPEPRRSGG
ncbi:MAG TPA: DUF1572 family protein [Gemmatimonadaceae bacterium]|nr:DUF1572 family protein [Gemmatimonadaceae bacterium]